MAIQGDVDDDGTADFTLDANRTLASAAVDTRASPAKNVSAMTLDGLIFRKGNLVGDYTNPHVSHSGHFWCGVFFCGSLR